MLKISGYPVRNRKTAASCILAEQPNSEPISLALRRERSYPQQQAQKAALQPPFASYRPFGKGSPIWLKLPLMQFKAAVPLVFSLDRQRHFRPVDALLKSKHTAKQLRVKGFLFIVQTADK